MILDLLDNEFSVTAGIERSYQSIMCIGWQGQYSKIEFHEYKMSNYII